MASSDLKDELNCSICLGLYTDPVYLRCGHNFCRACIVRVLGTQDGGYSCPDCRAEYQECPPLKKNRKLGNIVERFLSTQPDMQAMKNNCTYCIKSPVPAVKFCLQCENYLCDDHLTAHNKTVDHVLVDPTVSFGNRKCPIHKKVLEYYCPQDEACLCVSCCLVGKHRRHRVELVDEASRKRKKKLRKYLEKLNSEKTKIPTGVQNLHNHLRNIQKKASDKKEYVHKLFMDIKEQLEIAEKKALGEISRQEEEIVSQISDLIKKLEIKEDELSRKMHHLEEMCQVTDPIRVLQEPEITVCGHGDGEDTGGDGEEIKSEDDLDEVVISLTLHRSMRDIVTNVTSQLGFQVPDILLDEDTAHGEIEVSKDLKTATQSLETNRPESPGRTMNSPQVLSRCGFSSGRHYWEVEWNQIGTCDIGVSYPHKVREDNHYIIRLDDNTWCLYLDDGEYFDTHDSLSDPLYLKPTCPTFGVFLDYEAGRLSFYELCDPIRHLQTFNATFTEPLHVLFYVQDEASLTVIG